MATVQCSKCTAERKGFRRELDSWRYKLIHCVGFESILKGIYGSMLMRDLNLFDDCEPEEVDDWSPATSLSHCSFCNLPLDKLSDQVPAAASPLSSPSDYSPCQAPTSSESSQTAQRFLQAVFHKKDVSLGCDSNIPLIAQELMKKMIHQFAMEYASKCRLHTSTNGVTTRTSSPLSETSDTPLDLTVSRNQEEKQMEPEPADGVLDLSNRNVACSATSTSSSNEKASGCLPPSDAQGFGDLRWKQKRCLQSSALDTVLRSLCPAHCSLLYQMLKLAHQEKLLCFLDHRPVGPNQSHCCHCGVHPQDNVTPPTGSFLECKSHISSSLYPLTDCDHSSCGSPVYHPGDAKSNCSIHSYPLKGHQSEAPSCCFMKRCRMETFTIVCPKKLQCISHQSLAIDHINNVMCSFAPSSPLLQSSSLCTPHSSFTPSSSTCCNHHNTHRYTCYSPCVTHLKNTFEKRDSDPPCPVLKREHSPSPPPLSPIPSDVDKKNEEKPPSLRHHRQEEETDLIVRDGLVDTSYKEEDMETGFEEKPECRTLRSINVEHNPNGTSLQDVVNRFSEKLDTIGPLEKEPPLASTAAIHLSEKEMQQSPSTSQHFQFHADAHLTEIITTVLHTGRASDYNLSELFNRHDNKQPKSPNTRLRRRQEVLAAMATPADDSSTRRHTLQIKRDLAKLDQTYSRKKLPLVKRAKLKGGQGTVDTASSTSPDFKLAEDERQFGLDGENQSDGGGLLNCDTDEVEKEKERVIAMEDGQNIKAEKKETEIFSENRPQNYSGIEMPEMQSKFSKDDGAQLQLTKVKPCGESCKNDGKVNGAETENFDNAALGQPSDSGEDCHNSPVTDCCNTFKESEPSHHSNESRRSRRNIVPPQRFSSYVTEPMFLVACFPKGPLNQKARHEKGQPSTALDALSKNPDGTVTDVESKDAAPETPSEPTEEVVVETAHVEQCELNNTISSNQVISDNVENNRKPRLESTTDGNDCAAKTIGRLRPSPKRHSPRVSQSPPKGAAVSRSAAKVESPPTLDLEYISPIKLMFVSPVKDKEGVKYSLKSAGSSSCVQGVEPFDPCVESSWSGMPEKKNPDHATQRVKSSPLKSATSPAKSAHSPTKSASSPTKSGSTPAKSPSTPPKSSPKSGSTPAKSPSTPPKSSSSAKSPSPKSMSSSPRSRRSSEGTPTKRGTGTESQRSQGDTSSPREVTPPKRRPGRPKKLGPRLEQKVKRPIGRPRKQRVVDAVMGEKEVNGKSVPAADAEENGNKNLKITVVYGRSRRNKRMVSESFDQLQTEFHDAWNAVGLGADLLTHNSKIGSGSNKTASTEMPELNFVTPIKESTPQISSNIKCQKRDDAISSRKPGRPAKVKISGISVTVTTVSPKQRKIQINKDSRQSAETQAHKKTLLPEFRSAKEPRTIIHQSTSKSRQPQEGAEPQDSNTDKLPNQPVAVRHSKRVRKPSIYFLHAVATSTTRSYSHSNALLRRSKQLLLNKASNERKQGNLECSGEARRAGLERKNISQDLGRVGAVSVDSIFTPKPPLRWWAASAEEKTLNQELARRIRLISDSWVSDAAESQDGGDLKCKTATKGSSSTAQNSKHPSVVRALFDCPPNKPRSCSMQQLCSWFMQTTETQSLAIVKKASSRNPYEVMHFPRSVKKSICHSPQAERLRKHIKKFAKTVPKSPLQHKQAQLRLREKKALLSERNIRRQLFTTNITTLCKKTAAKGEKVKSFGKYRAVLCRAKTRFLTRKQRVRWQKNQRKQENTNTPKSTSNGSINGLKPKRKALSRFARDGLSECLENISATSSVDQTQEPEEVPKEQNLCSKAWSPETLKECRVFLRKINSPDNESAEEEWDSCTVTLDDGSPPAYLFAGRERELLRVVKAVKRKRSPNQRTTSREPIVSSPESAQEQKDVAMVRQRGKCKTPGVASAEPPQPPPAKMLRQSRMRGLTGPRWCDFVFEN